MTGRNVKLDKLGWLHHYVTFVRQSLPLYFFVLDLEVIVRLHMLGTCTVCTMIFRIKVTCINVKVYIGQRVR